MTNIIILLTNVWVTTATLTPHYNGESTFNSATVWVQRAEWVEREIEVVTAPDGQITERTNRVVQVKLSKPDSKYVPGQPFWFGDSMWQFLPTNAPPPLSMSGVPLRYIHRSGAPPPIPQPPVPVR